VRPSVPGVRRPRARLFLVLALLAGAGGCGAAALAPPAAAPPLAAQPAAGAVLPARYDAATGRLFLTVRPGEELLYLNTLAAGLGTAGLDRGQLGT
jgi:hypothetical protein